LKCDGTAYDLDLRVKVKFDITNEFLRCGLLLMFNTHKAIEWKQSFTIYNMKQFHVADTTAVADTTFAKNKQVDNSNKTQTAQI